jgi:hypothetical protein
MPRVVQCRKSQTNDQSDGSGLCGGWWVRKVPRLRPAGPQSTSLQRGLTAKAALIRPT